MSLGNEERLLLHLAVYQACHTVIYNTFYGPILLE